MMRNLIGKKFELTEVVGGDNEIVSLTFISDDGELLRLEADAISRDDELRLNDKLIICTSIESLVEPTVGDEVLTDVFGGNFTAAPL